MNYYTVGEFKYIGDNGLHLHLMFKCI